MGKKASIAAAATSKGGAVSVDQVGALLLVASGNQYPRHYSQPAQMHNAHATMPPNKRPRALSSGTKVELVGSAMHMPDLSTLTAEVPWHTIAREFTVLSGEEAGAVFTDGAATATSSSHKSIGRSHSGADLSAADESSSSSAIKRQMSSNSNSSSSSHQKKKHGAASAQPQDEQGTSRALGRKSLLPAYEVAAPQFREVQPPPRYSHATEAGNCSEDEQEEDISDEAVQARHDSVLRSMREKWAQLQALKNEAALSRRGAGGDYLGFRPPGEGEGLPFADGAPISFSGSGSHMKYRKYLNSGGAAAAAVVNGAVPASGTKKRGHNMISGAAGAGHLKRRGRPPKAVKGGSSGHVSHRGNNQYTAIHAAAAAAAALRESNAAAELTDGTSAAEAEEQPLRESTAVAAN